MSSPDEMVNVRYLAGDEYVAELFEPAGDKIYRHPTFYTLPDEVNHM